MEIIGFISLYKLTATILSSKKHKALHSGFLLSYFYSGDLTIEKLFVNALMMTKKVNFHNLG